MNRKSCTPYISHKLWVPFILFCVVSFNVHPKYNRLIHPICRRMILVQGYGLIYLFSMFNSAYPIRLHNQTCVKKNYKRLKKKWLICIHSRWLIETMMENTRFDFLRIIYSFIFVGLRSVNLQLVTKGIMNIYLISNAYDI